MKDIISKAFTIKDKKTINLLKKSTAFSFVFCLLGILLMYIHYTYFISFDLFDISLIVFQTGLLIGVFSIMSAFIINKYKEDNC